MKIDLTYHLCLLLLSAIAVIVLSPLLIKRLKKSGKLDIPNHRSAHKTPTPSMGGIVFFSGILLTMCFTLNPEVIDVCGLVGAAGVLGFYDDRLELSSKAKFLFQGIIALGIYYCGFSVAPIVSALIGFDLPSFLDLGLTVFFLLGVVNAINLADGVDGLLTGIALLSSLVFSIVFYLQGQSAFLFLSMAMTGVTAAFLLYNFQPAKIFMGDTGSLLLGTYIAISVLKVAQGGEAGFSLVGISLVIFCCVDMLRLFLGRYLITSAPFKADRNHFHHVLLRLGWSHKKIALFIYSLNALLILTSVFLVDANYFAISLLTLILCCISFYGVLQFLIFRKHRGLWKSIIRKKNIETSNNQLLRSKLK